ncbi:uncharacterized protein LOC114580967 isoform X1 [Dendrobium catenatum]|uniref:uncharacterized protein LOC114580967 isoform X1 n=1 Tax=Dendrobium catenatum TaxID=906689 RepID=UPI00109F92F0|nr:uncharacterized protein LOC114580967 isoform X1 [Dendrobium catenatum]
MIHFLISFTQRLTIEFAYRLSCCGSEIDFRHFPHHLHVRKYGEYDQEGSFRCLKVFVLSACPLFSKAWIEVSGSLVRDVTKQFKNDGWFILNKKAQNCLYKGQRSLDVSKLLQDKISNLMETALVFETWAY